MLVDALIWVVVSTSTDCPLVVKEAIRAVTTVSKGTVAVIVVPETVAVTSVVRPLLLVVVKLKADISDSEDLGVVSVVVVVSAVVSVASAAAPAPESPQLEIRDRVKIANRNSLRKSQVNLDY